MSSANTNGERVHSHPFGCPGQQMFQITGRNTTLQCQIEWKSTHDYGDMVSSCAVWDNMIRCCHPPNIYVCWMHRRNTSVSLLNWHCFPMVLTAWYLTRKQDSHNRNGKTLEIHITMYLFPWMFTGELRRVNLEITSMMNQVEWRVIINKDHHHLQKAHVFPLHSLALAQHEY